MNTPTLPGSLPPSAAAPASGVGSGALPAILRRNLERNLADPEAYETEKGRQDDRVDPLKELGYPVELPDLNPDGTIKP